MAIYNANSSSNYRQYAANAAYNVNDLSIALWVQPQASAPALGSLLSKGPGTSNGDWNLGNNGGTSNFRAAIFTNNGLRTAISPSTWTTGTWYHVGMSYSNTGNNLRLWLNGSNVTTTTNAGDGYTSGTDSIRAFLRNNGGTLFQAYLAEFGFWSTELLTAEWAALAAGIEPLLIRPDKRIIIDRMLAPAGKDFQALGSDTGTLTYQAHPLIYRRPMSMIGKSSPAQTIAVVDSRSSLVPFNLRGPGMPMAVLAPSGMPLTWISPAGGDVTVAITGVSGTGGVGSVIPSTTVPVTGNVATGSVGSAIPSTTVALTGVAGTGAVGTVAPSTTVAITGNGATTAVGSVTPSSTVALTGVSATGAAGNVVGFVDTYDTRTSAVPFNLRGPGKPQPIAGPGREPLTWTETNTSSNVTVGITGVAGTGAVGSVIVATTVPATGNAGTASVGTVAPATTVAVTGSGATGAVGSVVPSTAVATTGVAGTSAVGALAPSTTVAATGVGATGAVGTVTASGSAGNVTVAITGVSATGSVGNVAASGGDTTLVHTRRTISTVLAQFDVNLALVASASSTTGTLRPAGHRFTLEREPLPVHDGDYFLDVEAVSPGMRNRVAGEAYWEATVVVRVAYSRGGGDAAAGDRQSVMRDGLGDAMRLSDVVENPSTYDSSNTGISEVRYLGATRAATFKRGEIWETRFLARWRSDSFTS